MSMIDDYTVTTVTWEAKSNSSGFGDPAFDAAVTMLGKVEHEEKLLKSAQTGERLISTTQLFFNPVYDIDVGDKITISSVVYEVALLDVHAMFEEVDHKEAVLVIA